MSNISQAPNQQLMKEFLPLEGLGIPRVCFGWYVGVSLGLLGHIPKSRVTSQNLGPLRCLFVCPLRDVGLGGETVDE